jgi:uncharacterized protein (TIGR03067 family)
MRRTILPLVGVLIPVVALASDSPKEYDDKTEIIGIEGTWRMVGNEKNVLTCHSGTWTIDRGDGGSPWDGTYRIDINQKPAHLDRFYANGPYTGSTFKYIYQIDGDVLRIGFGYMGSTRPQGFKDDGVRVATYKRVR